MTTMYPRDQVVYLVRLVYEQGLRDGREGFAGELLPALRWALAGCDRDPDLLDGGELDELLQVLTGPFDRLMSRHLRRVEQHQARLVAA